MTNVRTPRISWVLVVVLVAALATGAAASILVSASTTAPPPPGPASLVILPAWVVVAVSLVLIVALFASLLYQRFTTHAARGMGRYLLPILVVILLMIVFVVGARLAGIGGTVPSNSPPSTTTGNSTTGGSNVTHGKYLNETGGQIVLFPSLPSVVPFLMLAAVVLLVAVVAVPQTRRLLADRRANRLARARPAAPVPEGVRTALSRASWELDAGADPRAVILALYAELLACLEPMVGDVGTRTPEEIRVEHLLPLRVRPAAAATLTRLFEEARYSVHPLGPDAGTRARDAVRAALDDLTRKTFAP